VESLPSKRRILEKKQREEQGLKRKRGETSVEKLHVLRKKERIKFTSCWERFYQKKERKEIIIFYSAKSDMWPHPYLHIICICTTFYSLIFSFLPSFTTPFSINHDYLPHKLSRIFLYFYNIQGVA
jgi:hypothetical protein